MKKKNNSSNFKRVKTTTTAKKKIEVEYTFLVKVKTDKSVSKSVEYSAPNEI